MCAFAIENNAQKAYIAMEIKIKRIIEIIETDGWYLARTKGSHRQFKHLTKKGLVTVAGHPSDSIAKGTLNSILKQAQLTKKH